MSILVIAENRKARFNYEILDTFEAGVQLLGTEVKSVRNGKINIGDSYCLVRNNEAWWMNGHIPAYSHGGYVNHEPFRTRKLLLHGYEIKRLVGLIQEKGLTLVPLKCYWKGSKLKLEFGVGRGKKMHDKRATTKERDWKREQGRIMKGGSHD
ncbi:SsrA-binding protein SmpB [Magnetofaba australis]|uniref:SsrA-binding protein n=1 Tax=Magnetofaba australis IT-1 TaxID=1434232 RepID=A0A1Y2JYQ5_9PROT|nr:SsrA-binding protein SmpB [Magnetofaba australis]OSM00015.1 putative SsrA-binding protein [Magnetofaba australis IT-1]